MFEELILLGDGQDGIILHTRLRREILNSIALPPQERHLIKYDQLRRSHPFWRQRKRAYGGYNCWGMIFASRRTAVYEDVEVRKILEDDGYRKITRADAAVDDVVIYRDSLNGLMHGGRIVEIRPAASAGLPSAIIVLSKWDDSTGEDIHAVAEVPFPFDCPVEYWTERV